MVFLYQMAQLGIFLLQMFVGIGFYLCVAHLCRQVVFGAGLADKGFVGFLCAFVTEHLTLDLCTHRVQGLNAAFRLFVEDMPSVLRTDRRADLTGFHAESGVLKRLDHHSLSEPS